MDCKVRDLSVHYEEVGAGRPLLVLHGWSSDCYTEMPAYEPLFARRPGWRRIYPDVAAIAKPPIPAWFRGPDQLLDVLLEFMDSVAPGERFAVSGISWGGYLAAGVVHHRPSMVAGVLFNIPSLEIAAPQRDVPARHVIREDPAFASALRPEEQWLLDFFVVQDERLLDLVRSWSFPAPYDPTIEALLGRKAFSFDPTVLPEPCPAPALFLTGRQDQIVGYRKAWSLIEQFPRATFAVLDRAGHMLDAEQPAVREALVNDWLDRVEEYTTQ
jgi:pimeloyl-ACP methyl ester carboxylesterase